MSNNTSSTCWLSDTIYHLRTDLSFFTYCILSPIYFVIGVTTRGLCLISFLRQYKKEKAYAYQVFTTLSEILEVTSVFLCMSTINNLSGYRIPGAVWFQRNYFLMWYAAHVSIVYQGFITASLLMHVSMAADRAFAMIKPFKYKNINHNRHQVIATIVSFIVGISTTLFDVFRFNVRQRGDLYELYVDDAYVATKIALGLALLRNTLRIVANVALVISNLAMVIYYRRNFSQVHSLEGNGNGQRAARRKATQRTLILLTLCQSIFMTGDITMYNVYYSLIYGLPGFADCSGKLMAPFNDLVLQVGGILEFFALMAISKQFRQTVFLAIRCKKATNSVSPGINGTRN